MMQRESVTRAVLLGMFFFGFPGLLTAAELADDPATLLKQYVNTQYHPLGDYVPCMFDDDEANAMRTRGTPAPKSALDPDGSDAFVKLVQAQSQALFGVSPAQGRPRALAVGSNYEKMSTSLTSSDYQNLTIDAACGKLAAAAKSNGLTDAQTLTLVSNLKSQVGGGGIQRPDDVSCSFSILPWRETKEVFGRMVANDYIAIEVNIRNLNKQNEFLVHDIQVAVDTGLDADSFGRFEAARDKLIVRGVAQRGESDDVRNRTMNILSTVGALAGGASGALTQTVQAASSSLANWLSTSVAVFQGPFLSGLNKIWPDNTIGNVNNVSDLAFSASSTTKTVIPVQGSVPLVTFLAQQPLVQLPFARCGKDSKTAVTSASQCSLKVENAADGAAFAKPLDFHSWAPAALNILKHRTYVVVAGVHIQQVSPNAQADNISCPIVTDGTIDLSAQDKSGDVSCTISGANLGTAKSAKLEQGTSTSLSATLTAAADGNSAILSFKASDFAGKSGTFEVFWVDSSAKETNLNQPVKFAVRLPAV